MSLLEDDRGGAEAHRVRQAARKERLGQDHRHRTGAHQQAHGRRGVLSRPFLLNDFRALC